MNTLFPDEVLKQAEQDIATFKSKNQPLSSKKGRFHPYERTDKRSDNRKPERPAGSSHTNDNQCVISPVQGLLPGSLKTVKRVYFIALQ